MTDSESAFVKTFNQAVDSYRTFTYVTRNCDLQRAACKILDEQLKAISVEKEGAIGRGANEYANILLGYQSLASAVKAEIRMCVLLKEGLPDDAWNELVDAQAGIADAIRADAGFGNLGSELYRLEAIEMMMFPPQRFLSSGMIVESQICTICGKEYEDCDHVKGRPYMGEFCRVRLIPSKVDHVAIVDKPANKKCRIFKIGFEGGYRNCMTWVVEPMAEKDSPPLA